jgi:hypothetical protein
MQDSQNSAVSRNESKDSARQQSQARSSFNNAEYERWSDTLRARERFKDKKTRSSLQ